MRAGLASLDVLESQQLGPRAMELGETFRAKLRNELAPFEMVKEVRGMGLLSGIEFVAPKKLSLRMPFEAFHRIHPAMFGQILVMRMFREKNILTQIWRQQLHGAESGAALVVKEEQLDEFVAAIRSVCGAGAHFSGFLERSLRPGSRAANV